MEFLALLLDSEGVVSVVLILKLFLEEFETGLVVELSFGLQEVTVLFSSLLVTLIVFGLVMQLVLADLEELVLVQILFEDVLLLLELLFLVGGLVNADAVLHRVLGVARCLMTPSLALLVLTPQPTQFTTVSLLLRQSLLMLEVLLA